MADWVVGWEIDIKIWFKSAFRKAFQKYSFLKQQIEFLAIWIVR